MPLCGCQRLSIHLDSDALHYMLEVVKIDPKKNGKQLDRTEITANENEYSFRYLNDHEICRIESNEKYSISEARVPLNTFLDVDESSGCYDESNPPYCHKRIENTINVDSTVINAIY